MLERGMFQDIDLDKMVIDFEDNTPFGVYFDELNTHNKRNLAILLKNQMTYVKRLTEVELGTNKPFDIIDFACKEFKKLAFNFPTNIFALPVAVTNFKYYNKDGEKKDLCIRGRLRSKGYTELSDTLKAEFNRYEDLDGSRKFESFYVFPLLLWVCPTKPITIDGLITTKPEDCWFGDTMYVVEGEPKKE